MQTPGKGDETLFNEELMFLSGFMDFVVDKASMNI